MSINVSKIPWSPINEKHFEVDSDDDDDEDDQRATVIPRVNLPITPPPSNLPENIPAPVEEIFAQDVSVELDVDESIHDSVPEPSVETTVDDDLEVPQHIVELADMAEELVVDPSLDAEEYVDQFSPENQVPGGHDSLPSQEHPREPYHKVQQEEIVLPEDDLAVYLQSFEYDQHRLPQKKDIIFFYDSNINDFVKVKIISKSNYRYYFNFK